MTIFWSASEPGRHLTEDVFCPWTHWKNRRLAGWFYKLAPTRQGSFQASAECAPQSIRLMADMRHAAAHRSMLVPAQPWPNRGFKEDQ
jgi:hypothetical protein